MGKRPSQKPPREAKDAVMNLRVRPSIKALAQARADADGRSLASYVERLILKDAQKAGD